MLTKKECENKVKNLKTLQDEINKIRTLNEIANIAFINAIECFEDLIKEHFEMLNKLKTGDLSDGYHTFKELYHHRAVLFSVIVNQNKELAWKSKKHHDGTMYDGMFIVGIDTPQGQYSYHYDIEPYWNMFDCKELDNAPEWDGHEPEDIDRLQGLSNNPPLKFEEIRPDDWVWDKKNKEWRQVNFAGVVGKDDELMFYEDVFKKGVKIVAFKNFRSLVFEENRFYRKEVQE